MFLIQDGKITGFVFRCPTCGFDTLNDRAWFCPKDNTRLKEVLLKDGV